MSTTVGPWWNPFLYNDPIYHSGGWEFRTGPETFSFHFRERYPMTPCDNSGVLDEFHFDAHNPLLHPFQHLFQDFLPNFVLNNVVAPTVSSMPWAPF